MRNLRIIINLIEDNETFTVNHVKIISESRETGDSLARQWISEEEYKNTTSLFHDVQDKMKSILHST